MKAVYAGSFDPPTLGHEYIIREAMAIFTDLTIAVAHNPAKDYSFSLDERKNMLEQMVLQATESNQDVDSHKIVGWEVAIVGNEFLVDYAAKIGATHLIRGIRNVQDFEYERSMAAVNQRINQRIKTIFIMPPVDLAEVSSSLVKSLVGIDGWHSTIRHFVPPCVEAHLCNLAEKKRVAIEKKLLTR
jgi:pantetheine-phosphate adenylyltransferase